MGYRRWGGSARRVLLSLMLLAAATACGGGGGGGGPTPSPSPSPSPSPGPSPTPMVVFSDDFSSGSLTDYLLCSNPGLGAPPMISNAGNPGPGLLLSGNGSEATSVTSFDLSQGLTIEWDSNINGSASNRGGLSLGTGCNGPAADTLAAGISNVDGFGQQFILNGMIIGTIANPPPPLDWTSLRVTIAQSGTVDYYVNGILEFQSSTSVSVSSPRPISFQQTASATASFIDNVVLTQP